MTVLCKILGHNFKYDTVSGINPRIMKRIHRSVKICSRGDFREITDTVIGDYDIKEGRVYRGSGGPCSDCIHRSDCTAYRMKPPNASYAYCPVKNFSPLPEVKKFWDSVYQDGQTTSDYESEFEMAVKVKNSADILFAE